MKNTALALVLSITCLSQGYAQASILPDATTEGLILLDGVFHPVHSLSLDLGGNMGGGTDGGYSVNWELGATQAEEFLARPEEERRSYVQTLTGPQKRDLYLSLDAEELPLFLAVFEPRLYSKEDYDGQSGVQDQAIAAYREDRDNLQSMLDAMTNTDLVGVLNQMEGWVGPYVLGEWEYYGTTTWGQLEGLNLSGRNLTGLNTTGKFLVGSNLVGATISLGQLEAADWDAWFQPGNPGTKTNLSGQNLSQANITGWRLSGANLANTGLTAQQIATTSGGFSGSDLSGNNLVGLDMNAVNWSWMNTDLRNTGLTGAELNNVQHISGANLSGLNLSTWNVSNKPISNVVLEGATVSANTLAQASDIKGISLKNTGITKASLDAALVAVGKDPNETIPQTWQPVYGWPPHPEGGYWETHNPPLPGAFNTSTITFE